MKDWEGHTTYHIYFIEERGIYYRRTVQYIQFLKLPSPVELCFLDSLATLIKTVKDDLVSAKILKSKLFYGSSILKATNYYKEINSFQDLII